LRDLLGELRVYNNLFAKLSYFTGMDIINFSKMYVYDKVVLYKEGDESNYSFIILYGRVILKTKSLGVFRECLLGETLGEEILMYNKKFDKDIICRY
jgi:hypothetical protein